MRRSGGAGRRFADARTRMVERDLRPRGISDPRVLDAMARVPRHVFVPESLAYAAYEDCPLPIGLDQTISQPYIVALMTEALSLRGGERILELGTGSGYQTAILRELGAEVWSIERLPELAAAAERRLAALGYSGIQLRTADGTLGWPEAAPFDRLLATGGLPAVPSELLSQLREGGLFLGPVGSLAAQHLARIEYHATGSTREDLGGCRFVPLIGKRGWAV